MISQFYTPAIKLIFPLPSYISYKAYKTKTKESVVVL